MWPCSTITLPLQVQCTSYLTNSISNQRLITILKIQTHEHVLPPPVPALKRLPAELGPQRGGMQQALGHRVFKNTQTIRQSSQKHISTKLCMTHLLNVFKTCMKSQVLPPPEPVPNRLPPELAPAIGGIWQTLSSKHSHNRNAMSKRTLRTTAKYFARYFWFHLILIYFCRYLDQRQFAYLNWLQKWPKMNADITYILHTLNCIQMANRPLQQLRGRLHLCQHQRGCHQSQLLQWDQSTNLFVWRPTERAIIVALWTVEDIIIESIYHRACA